MMDFSILRCLGREGVPGSKTRKQKMDIDHPLPVPELVSRMT